MPNKCYVSAVFSWLKPSQFYWSVVARTNLDCKMAKNKLKGENPHREQTIEWKNDFTLDLQEVTENCYSVALLDAQSVDIIRYILL